MKLGVPKAKLDAAPADIKAELMKFRESESDGFYILNIPILLYAKHRALLDSKPSESDRQYAQAMGNPKTRERRAEKVLDRSEQAIRPLSRDQWPAWTTAVEAMRAESDTGIGDTIERMAGAAGRLFKVIFKEITGHSCGCDGRKDHFNLLYPYSPPTTPTAIEPDREYDQSERAE